MNDPHVTRRVLLAGAASAAVAAGLPGCSSDDSKPNATPSPTRLNEGALRRKIASLLVVGFRGQQVNDNDWIVKAIKGGLGGVILFDKEVNTDEPRNITSPEQVTALVKSLKKASPGRLIVSIDQEGGQITRLNPSDGFPAAKSQAEVGAANSATVTRDWAQGLVRSITSIGANLNYAPVVDLNVNPDNPAVGQLGRSFSANPNVVVTNATEEIRVFRSASVKTSIKHFPGLGSATGNTDFTAVDVSKDWTRKELEPFQRLIRDGMTDSVLVGHLVNTQLDGSRRPAALSRPVVTDLLRGQLGWKGPVVTDDMQAVAITSQFGMDEAVALALEAGDDLLVFGNQQTFNANIVDETVDTVLDLVRSGRISQKRIDESVARVDSLRPKR